MSTIVVWLLWATNACWPFWLLNFPSYYDQFDQPSSSNFWHYPLSSLHACQQWMLNAHQPLMLTSIFSINFLSTWKWPSLLPYIAWYWTFSLIIVRRLFTSNFQHLATYKVNIFFDKNNHSYHPLSPNIKYSLQLFVNLLHI